MPVIVTCGARWANAKGFIVRCDRLPHDGDHNDRSFEVGMVDCRLGGYGEADCSSLGRHTFGILCALWDGGAYARLVKAGLPTSDCVHCEAAIVLGASGWLADRTDSTDCNGGDSSMHPDSCELSHEPRASWTRGPDGLTTPRCMDCGNTGTPR